MLLNCKSCPGIQNFIDVLSDRLIEDKFDTITYKEWVSTDRSEFVTKVETLEDFFETLASDLKKCTPHRFLTNMQNDFLQKKKMNLKIGELMMIEDFSQNMNFVIQDSNQGYHWNHDQCTIYPVVGYFRNIDGQIMHESYCVISECLTQDATAVHLYNTMAIAYFKSKIGSISKVIHMSDGAGSQYKNRYNFVNLSYHEEDFGVAGEWHFSTTSHGKGASDGLGGNIKRNARLASIRGETISNAKQLYRHLTNKNTIIGFGYATTDDYTRTRIKLKNRYKNLKTVPGTRGFIQIIFFVLIFL